MLMLFHSAAAQAETTGTLTTVKGTVYKRAFTDDSRTEWAPPVVAQEGDRILSGMQIATGQDSLSELVIGDVTMRGGTNTLFTAMPERSLVYVMGGEFMFHHDRSNGDKQDYTICTENMYVVAKGTTLLFQEGRNGSRVAVLEGLAEVTNRLDQSIVMLTPGMAYESKAKPGRERKSHKDHPRRDAKRGAAGSSDDMLSSLPVGGLVNIDILESVTRQASLDSFGSVLNLSLLDLPETIDAVGDLLDRILLFDTLDSVTVLNSLPLNALDHSLLKNFPKQLSNTKHIEKALTKALSGKNSSVFKSLNVLQVPLKGYNIGGDALNVAKLPLLSMQHWSPTGIIPGGVDPLGLGRSYGFKKFRVTYKPKTTKVNATLINGIASSNGRGGVTSILGGTGRGRNASPVAVLGNVGNVGGLTQSALGLTQTLGGVTNVVGGLTSGLTGGRGGVAAIIPVSNLNKATGGLPVALPVNGLVGGVTGRGGALGGILGR